MTDTEPSAPGFDVSELDGGDVGIHARHIPGPAGLATVSMLDGAVELAFDTAQPDLVLSLVMPDVDDGRGRRLFAAVLGATAGEELVRWLAAPGPRPSTVVGAVPSDPTVARRQIGARGATGTQAGAGLFGRLALGLDELVRPELSELVRAISLVDLGAQAFDLADLGPSPDGASLVVAGLDRWESIDPDAWDDEGEALLAATISRSPQWQKSVFRGPGLASRIEALTSSLHRRDGRVAGAAGRARSDESISPVQHRLRLEAAIDLDASTAGAMGPLPAPAASPVVGAALASPAIDVEVQFDPDLDGRVISAEREAHHLMVNIGGLPDDDLWLRVYEAGNPTRLIAMVPVGPPQLTWRSATALIGPDVTSRDLLVDVTRDPKRPWRSSSARLTERATHLGREAARLSRMAVRGTYRREATAAWRLCADAWDDVGDATRVELAHLHGGQRPTTAWLANLPLLTDLP